jgi:hypothetical protein
MRVDVQAPADAEHASDCAYGAHSANIGGDVAQQFPNQFQLGTRVIDGQADAQVSCNVTGSGTFSFSGQLVQGGLQKPNATLSVSGSVPDPAKQPGATGHGNVTLITPQSIGHQLEPVTGSADCTFTPVEAALGRVWSKFDCPLLQANVQETAYCAATGYFVFENCAQ